MLFCGISLLETLYKSFGNIILLNKIPFIIRNNIKKESKKG